MPSASLITAVVSAAALLSDGVVGHGYMSQPISRVGRHRGANGPRMCGDSDGRYEVKGPITGTYVEGSEIDIGVVITAHHLGYFDFQICDNADALSEECFTKGKLKRANCDENTMDCSKWWKPPTEWEVNNYGLDYSWNSFVYGYTDSLFMKARFQLPDGLTCENCVLRWHYMTTNSCSSGAGGSSEMFYNCADIKITANPNGSGIRTESAGPVPVTCPATRIGSYDDHATVTACYQPGESVDCTIGGRTPPVVDPCASVVCQNGGTCLISNGAGFCSCLPGYEGGLCETVTPPPVDRCVNSPCINGGQCQSTGPILCQCVEGFEGLNCEIAVQPPVDPCSTVACQNEGVCQVINGLGLCACPDGFEGILCENPIVIPVDPCLAVPCLNGATCESSGEFYQCTCVEGFHGIHCENVDPCLADPCLNGATCESSGEFYQCSCVEGFHGIHCENSDPCLSNPCQNDGLCESSGEFYQCVCVDGFHGTHCEKDDPCLSNPCLNGATCESSGQFYQCTCSENHYGEHCENTCQQCLVSGECHNYSVSMCDAQVDFHLNNGGPPAENFYPEDAFTTCEYCPDGGCLKIGDYCYSTSTMDSCLRVTAFNASWCGDN